jgi:hypothetical protein
MEEILDNKDIIKQIENDITIKKEDIVNQVAQQPYLLDRYVKILMKRIRMLKNTNLEYDELYSQRFKHYKEEYEVVLQYKDVEKYTNGDKEIINKKREINALDNDINLLKETISNLKQKYFSMKLMLDYKQYLAGDKA